MKESTDLIERVEPSKDILDRLYLLLVLEKFFNETLLGQLLLDLLCPSEVVVDGGRLDRLGQLHHEPGVPLELGWVLVRVVATAHVNYTYLVAVNNQPLVLKSITNNLIKSKTSAQRSGNLDSRTDGISI